MKLAPKIRLGTDDFAKLLLHSSVFVDKSLFVKEFLEDSGDVALITRPRRWGKSINMDMLGRFLSVEVDQAGRVLSREACVNHRLFVGGEVTLDTDEKKMLSPLKIAQDQKLIETYQGKYPVIRLSLKDVRGGSLEQMITQVRGVLSETFRMHNYLLESDQLSEHDRKTFELYFHKKSNDNELSEGLRLLSTLLHQHFKKPVYIFIDEYDTPVNYAYLKFRHKAPGMFEQALDLFRGLLGATFKTNPHLAKGLVTGILRIAKANIFSDLNNVCEYTLLDEPFSGAYGFTQAEVDTLLAQVPTTVAPAAIRHWYNGYTFGNKMMYNPWSIMCCLANKGKLDHYWIDSGEMALVNEVMLTNEIQADLQKLVAGEVIERSVMRQIRFEDIQSTSGLYSLLLFSGYLNPGHKLDGIDEDIYELSIPNQEVRVIYKKRILDWVSKQLHIDTNKYLSFVQLLANNDVDGFESELKRFLRQSSSFYQTGDKVAELFYSGFMFCLMHLLAAYYVVESETESGAGRADTLLIPKSHGRTHGLVIEYKVSQDKDSLPAVAQAGLDQILAKDYATKLQSYPHVRNILAVCMAFCGKELVLKKTVIQ